MRMRGVEIEEVGSLLERLTGKLQLEGLRPSNLLFCEGFNMKQSLQLTQRVASSVIALVGLLLFLPFFPFVALAIKLSSKGPIFFSQTRVGLENETFKVHKFRTMFTDAEAKGARWATKDDPRVTRLGGFLRKTRIDEIPQLWNVLRGEMSFVGPRPERPEFTSWLAEEIPFYNLRHMVRPGLTGWAQVRYGYGATLAESPREALLRPLLPQAQVDGPRLPHHVRDHQDDRPPPRRPVTTAKPRAAIRAAEPPSSQCDRLEYVLRDRSPGTRSGYRKSSNAYRRRR